MKKPAYAALLKEVGELRQKLQYYEDEVIQELNQHKEELERQNVFIQTILDNLPIGVALNNFEGGDATYINRKFQEIYGWPEEDLKNIARFFEKVYPEEAYRNEITKRIMEDINSGDINRMHWENVIITRKDGEKRVVNAVNIPLIEQNVMVSTVMDVSDRKRYEKELEEKNEALAAQNEEYLALNEELDQSLKMVREATEELQRAKEQAEESDRLKSAFLANMSHEIRTPMNGILGFADLLKEPNLSGDEQNTYLDIIERSGQRMLAIINDLIHISKIEAGEVELHMGEVDLLEEMEMLFDFFSLEIKQKGLKFVKVLPQNPEGLRVKTDQEKVYAILSNLLKNAIKYTHEGYVAFGCELDDLKSSSSGQINFYVRDTGIGIPENRRQAIFDRFVQNRVGNHQALEGVGLGLAICKAYAELLDGQIRVEDNPDGGTCFYFSLPWSK